MTAPPDDLARNFDLEALHAEESVLVALDHDDRIAWVNGAWTRFALENGGAGVLARHGVGSCYLDGVRGPLADYFRRGFASVRESGDVWEVDYECSSPELYRLHRMRVLPTASAGLLVEHNVVEARPHDRPPEVPQESHYRDERGVLMQCSNCRKVRRVGDGWRWIPAWVATTPAPPVSHGLCATCEGVYVARARNRRRASRGGTR